MGALRECTGLTSLNGYSKLPVVLAGELSEYRDGGHELALAVGPFLPRSASTLTSLDLGQVISKSLVIHCILLDALWLHLGQDSASDLGTAGYTSQHCQCIMVVHSVACANNCVVYQGPSSIF
jgi:hypothetical protein